MKTKYTVILLLIMFWVKAPITAQTNSRVTEIFSYLGTHSNSFMMTFILATGKQSEKIAVAQYDSPVYVYDSKKDIHEYYNEPEFYDISWAQTKFVTFFDNDTKLFSAFTNYNEIPDSAFIYDIQTQKLLSRFSTGDSYIGCSEDGDLLFSQPNTYNKCIIRNTMNQEIISTINIIGNISKIAYPENSNTWCMLISESGSYSIVVFEKNTNKELYRFSPTNKYIRTFRMSPNGEYILSTGASDIAKASQATLYSLKTKKIIRRHTGELFDKVSEGEFSPDGKYYVYAINHTMYKYDIESDKDPVAIPLYHLEGGAVMGMRWISGTSKLAVQGATEEGFYSTIIDLENPAYQKLFGLPDFYYMHLLSGGDKALFFGKEVVLFDRRTSEIQWNFPGYIRQRCFDIREDLEKMLFIEDGSKTMYVMNLNSTVVYHKINIGRSDICCMRFSRSSEKVLYLTDKRDTVFIYDLQTYETRIIPLQSNKLAFDFYWDDIESKRLFVHGENGSYMFDENLAKIKTTNSNIFIDNYDPQYTVYKKTKGKWVFDNKPIMISALDPKYGFGLYNFVADTIVYSNTNNNDFIPNIINGKDIDIYYYSLIDDDKKFITISNDTVLRQWDLSNYSLLSERRLPYVSRNSNSPQAYYAYVAAHKDGISTVATLTDNRRVVFMEIPDAPVSVYEEKISQKSEITSYPQPIITGDGHCTLNLPTADIESITAITVLGEIIPLEFSKTSTNTYRFSVENLSPGQYSLQIITETQQTLYHTIIVL